MNAICNARVGQIMIWLDQHPGQMLNLLVAIEMGLRHAVPQNNHYAAMLMTLPGFGATMLKNLMSVEALCL